MFLFSRARLPVQITGYGSVRDRHVKAIEEPNRWVSDDAGNTMKPPENFMVYDRYVEHVARVTGPHVRNCHRQRCSHDMTYLVPGCGETALCARARVRARVSACVCVCVCVSVCVSVCPCVRVTVCPCVRVPGPCVVAAGVVLACSMRGASAVPT